MRNSGQSCNAPTRMLVPAAKMKEVAAIAKATAEAVKVGDPEGRRHRHGPGRLRGCSGTRSRATSPRASTKARRSSLVAPAARTASPRAYYVKPTIFADVDNAMTIAQEEIFGPVLAIIPYKDEADAIAIANDSPFGLAAYVSSADRERAKRVARQLKAGMVHVNHAPADSKAPFGGMKQSGNGREWGRFGIEEYLEVKSVMGLNAA